MQVGTSPARQQKTFHAPNNINLREIKTEDVEHVALFEKIFNIFSIFCIPFGFELKYNWTPKGLFWFIVAYITFTWLCIFYTQGIHINNGDFLRVLEACAIYGIASSVDFMIL